MRTLGAALLLAAILSGEADAGDYYVEPVVSVGDVSTDDAAAVEELIRNGLQSHGQAVVSAAGPAVYSLRTRLVRQADAYTVTIEKILDGKVVHAAKAGPEPMAELQNEIDLLVRSAISGRPPETEREVDELEPDAAAPSPRKKPLKQWMLGFGPVFMNDAFERQGEDKGGVKPNVSLARLWQLDDASLRLFAESTFIDDNDRLVGGGLAVAYMFSREKTSPFVAADLGYGAALRGGREDAHGFQYGGLAGVQFFRTSEINLEVAFRAFALAKKVEGRSPAGYGFRVALSF